MSLLDETVPKARCVGAVNTIVKHGERLVGHNTDVYGFTRSLKERAAFDPQNKSVLLLGAGGAARAAAFALIEEGTSSLTIANRTLERAEHLADDVRSSAGTVRAISIESSDLVNASASADLIVNATSIGMSHSDGEGKAIITADVIPPSAVVYDMVYTPAVTPLLGQALKAGARTLGGLWMLIYQGAEAFELWTDKNAPIEVMYEAAERALNVGSLSRLA